MPALDLKTKTLKFHATDESALANALTLTEIMEGNCPEVKAAAVSATDNLKKLLEHVKKARAPKVKPEEKPETKPA